MRDHRTTGRAFVSAVLMLVLGGCASPPPQRSDVVAVLDGHELRTADLERYFSTSLPEGFETDDETDRDLVFSRLFDNFIAERLLLLEAERRGIEVSNAEIGLFLLAAEESGETTEDPDGARVSEVRSVLMVQKLRESHLKRAVSVTEDEVDAYLEENRERLLPERVIVLRSLLLESAGQARKVHRDLKRKRVTFEEAVIAHGTAPGQGVPLEVALDSLPPDVRESVEKLRPGGITEPLELHGSHYLFRLDRKPEHQVDETSLRDQAREELLRERRHEALENLIAELRGGAGVEILPENLPFVYRE